MERRSKALLFWPVLLLVTAVDAVTKMLARRWLPFPLLPHDVLGNTVRFTLVYNPGAAFGINFGGYSRWIFMALTVIALLILARLYAATRNGHTMRIVALALVCGGAIGNLIDRMSSGMGVVDFIDVGLRTARWPTFNVADMAVSVGAVLLALVLWTEDRSPAAVRPASSSIGERPAGEIT